MSYFTPIPQSILAQVPIWVSMVNEEPINVTLSSFDEDGVSFFGLDVDYNPRYVERTDKRQNDYIVVERHTMIVDYDGHVESTLHDRYHRFGDASVPAALPVVKEAAIQAERDAEQRENIKAMYANRDLIAYPRRQS